MKNVILLIGTGAISDLVYLPVLSSQEKWRSAVRCVDKDVGLGTAAAERHRVVFSGSDYKPLLQEAILAIVATPPRSHYTIARDCLECGVPVILEKPLTNTYSEGRQLVSLAEEKGLQLMVNNTRRLFQSYREINDIIRSGELGEVRSIDYGEGGVFAWPTASGFYFDAKGGGRGVLSDRGAHVLDLFCWWANAELRLESCRTDEDGGVEGYCDVSMVLPRGKGRMRLSWHNKLSNRVEIQCDRGILRTGIYDFREVSIQRSGRWEKRTLKGSERAFEDYGFTFARRAISAVLEGGSPPVSGGEVLGSLKLIDDCYERKERLKFPWLYRFGGKS